VARRRVTKLGDDSALFAFDGVKAREDDEFVGHVKTWASGAAGENQTTLVQLGGLEPPTSCSTVRPLLISQDFMVFQIP
jgi:hypothetical protein